MKTTRPEAELEESLAQDLNVWALKAQSKELKVFALVKELSSISPMDLHMNKRLLSKRAELIDALNDLLKSYKCTPEVFEDDDSMWGAVWKWEYAPSRQVRGQNRLSKWEALAFVQNVLRLASEGQLSRIGQCEICGKWKVFRQTDQRFCSSKCKQREYESRDDVRLRRNANRKRNYHEAIARDVRNRAR